MGAARPTASSPNARRQPGALVRRIRLAVVVAVPLGLLIGWYRPVADLLGPLLEVFRNTAALALLPVFVLLLGIGETSKISIVVYACAWPILLNTISAVRNVDPTCSSWPGRWTCPHRGCSRRSSCRPRYR